MNKFDYIIGIFVILLGCTKAEIKPFERISGEWVNQSFEYRTEDGTMFKIDTLDFHLKFENCNDRKDENAKRCDGKLISEEKQYDFKYLASIASGNKDVLNITIDSAILSPETYPVELIGLSNVYSIWYQDKDKMVLQTDDQEWFVNHETGDRIDQLKWTFKKR